MDVVQRVQAAMSAGAHTRREIARTTQLDAGIVDAVVDVLLRTNAIDAHALRFECGAGGCGNCVQQRTCTPGPVPVRIGPRR